MSTKVPRISEAALARFEEMRKEIIALRDRPLSERMKPLTPEQIEKLAERRPVEIFCAEMRQFRTPYDDQGGG